MNDSAAPIPGNDPLEQGPHFFVSKRRPRKHQAEALEKMEGRRAFALLMSMRTGKSKCAVDDWGKMVSQGQVDDALIIGPMGALGPWPEALRQDLR